MLSEEFAEKFLNNKANFKLLINNKNNEDEKEEEQINKSSYELDCSTSELKIIEIFCLNLFENLRTLCNQEQMSSNVKMNVSNLISI